MENMTVLLEPVRASLHAIGQFLPLLLLGIAIVIAGWLLAKALRFAVVKTLRAINFQVLTEKAGVDPFLRQGGVEFDTVSVLGALVYALVIVAAFMVAFNSMGLAYVTELLGRVVLFVPRVILAVLVLAFGAYFARFVGTALAAYCRGLGISDADALGRLATYAIMVFVILIALDQLGLGDLIRHTFLILVAAIALALAIAFGLGGQKRAGELIEEWSGRKGEAESREPRPPVI